MNLNKFNDGMEQKAFETQYISKQCVDFCLNKATLLFVKNDFESAITWIYFGATMAWSINPGYFYNKKMENLLNEISFNTFSNEYYNIEIENNSYPDKKMLHVISTASNVGGHTRLVNMLIKNCSENFPGQIHSICLTQQRINIIPNFLLTTINNCGGSITVLSKTYSFLKKAHSLRKLARHFDNIILYTHPNDPIANLSFYNFPNHKKIFFYNHADHVFSLGVSVCNTVFDFRKSGQRITKSERFNPNTILVPIPLENKVMDMNCRNKIREEARKQLNIGKETLVILTIGDEYKYKNALGYNFKKSIHKIINKFNDIKVFAIGIPKNSEWLKLYQETNYKFIPLDRINDKRLIDKYYSASNLYIESFPFGSLTAMLDAGMNMLPIIRMHNVQAPILSSDDISLDDDVLIALDEDNYANMAIEILNFSNEKRNEIGKKIRNKIIETHCGKEWVELFLTPALGEIRYSKYQQYECSTKIDTLDNEKNSITLFQLANNGTMSLILSAISNSNISFSKIIQIMLEILFVMRKKISFITIKLLIANILYFSILRTFSIKFIYKVKKIIA